MDTLQTGKPSGMHSSMVGAMPPPRRVGAPVRHDPFTALERVLGRKAAEQVILFCRP